MIFNIVITISDSRIVEVPIVFEALEELPEVHGSLICEGKVNTTSELLQKWYKHVDIGQNLPICITILEN